MRIILSIILSLGFICSSAQQDTLSIFTGLLRKMKAEYDKGESRDKRLMLQYCDAALALSPGNKTLFLNCRIAALELGDTTLAVEYLRRAVNALPFESDLATSYGWHLLTHNMPDSAYYYCKRAYDLNRSSLAAVINYAHVLFLNNRQAAAKVIYAEAMDMVNTLEEYTENQEADFTTFAALYPAAGFNELRVEQRKKMEALLEQYKSANTLALQYAKLNNTRSTTPQQLVAKINEALTAEEAMDEKRVKRISHYLCSRANMEYTYFSNVTGYLAGYKAAIPYLIWDSNDDEQGLRLRSIGTIYSNLGMPDSAFTYFNAAAKAFHSVGDDRQIAQTYLAVARLYVADNNNDQLTIVNDQEDVSSGVRTALGIAHGDVLPYFLRYNYNEGLVDAYEFIADCYIGHKRIRNLDSAVYYLQKAVYTSKMNLMPDDNLMAVYNDLASVEMRRGNYDKGREYLLKVDELIKAGSEEESSRNVNNLYNLGYYYFVTGKFDSAIFYCQRSVDLLFRIRKTLSNKEKMSLVSSQAGHFSLLGSAYFQEKNYDGILLSIEQCRTMVLADKMGADNIAFSTIAQIQAGMTKDQVYYITGFTDENRSPSRKLLLVIDKEHALAKILSDSSFVVNSCQTSHGPYLDTIFTRFRKSNMEGDGPLKNKELNLCTLLFESKLASASGRSRGLEIEGGQQDDVASATDNTAQMGRLMYRELIQPFESMLKGKKEMIVLTDGFLNFMPFDALIMSRANTLQISSL